MTLNRDDLHQSLGFRNTDSVIKNVHQIAKNNITISNIESDPTVDLGTVATIHQRKQNTSRLQSTGTFGDVVHCNIGFGSKMAIGGTKYALFFVDKATRFKYVYPLKDLQSSSIIHQMNKLFVDMGITPKLIRTDFDHKIIGGAVRNFLRDNKSQSLLLHLDSNTKMV